MHKKQYTYLKLSQYHLTIGIVVLLTCYGYFGINAQVFPVGVQAVLNQIIGGKNISCQADYAMEYDGLKTPIVFKLAYLNAADGCRFDVDLANGSPFTQEMAKRLSPFKADKPIMIFQKTSKMCFTLWPELRVFLKKTPPKDQLLFYGDNLNVHKTIISEEDVNGVMCNKYKMMFDLGGNIKEEAYMWQPTNQSSLPSKIEMETDDLSGQKQKATIIFQNWKDEVEDGNKFIIPHDFKEIQNMSEVAPQEAAQTPSSKSITKSVMASSPVVEYFKSFLVNPPNIAELTFKRVDIGNKKTKMFTGKWQANAMYFREVNTTDEVDGVDQDPRKIIVARYGMKSSVFQNNFLLSSGDPLVKITHLRRVDQMSLYEDVGEKILSEPLKMGILFANYKTFKWEGNNFASEDVDGGQITGRLIVDDKGYPNRIVYTRESNKMTYQVNYEYSVGANSNSIPSKMSLAFGDIGPYADYVQLKPYKEYFILNFKTSAATLPESEFSLEKFKRSDDKPALNIVYSNHMAFAKIDGKMLSLPLQSATAKHARGNRFAVLCIMLLMTIVPIFILVWKQTTKTKQQ